MSSECQRQQGKGGKMSISRSPGNEYNGSLSGGDRRTSLEAAVAATQITASHLQLSGQEWNMEGQHRSPRNRKKGNLEKDNKGRRDPRGGHSSLTQSSQQQQQQSRPQMNATHVFQSDAEAPAGVDGHLTMSLGARPKLFPRQGGSSGLQAGTSQMDKDSSKFKFSSNSEKQINSEEITKSLKQIRDYISHITSTIEAMENLRDPSIFEKLERLRRARSDLLENERQLVELIERISVLSRDPMNDQSANTDASYNQENQSLNNEEFSDASVGSDEDEGNEINDAVSGTDAFLRRNELLKKMADSQEKLKALQDHQAMLLNLKRRVESRLSDTRALHEVLNQQSSEVGVEDMSRDERPPPVGHHQAQENRQRRFPTLHDERCSHEGHEVNLADEDQVSDSKYRELEKKWLGLQKERDQIDLLRELHLLQDNRMMESATIAGDKLAAFEQNCSKARRNSNNPRVVSGDAEGAATMDKTKKVEDKKWLKSLQGLESNTPKKLSVSNHSEQLTKSSHPDYIPDETRDEQQMSLRKSRKTKKSNLSYNKDDNDASANVSANKQPVSNTEIQQRLDFLISELHEDLDDGHYEERTKKLSAAKSKLQKLQGILSVVQQAQQDGETICVDYVEQLLDSVDGDELIYNEVQAKENVRPNQRFKNQTSAAETSNTKDANDSKSSRKFTFDNPRQTQRMEPVGMNDSRRESNSSHDVGTLSSIDARDSNNELWLDMRRQLALTEELRQRRRELESLMQKDAGKSYLLNQDIKEENHSAKSEPLRKSATASVVADSMSAATWGGSSFDNETQETIDGTNDSQEEKTEVVEDEEYSSEGPIVVGGGGGGGPGTSGLNDQFESRSSKVTNRITPGAVGVESRRVSRSNPTGAVTGGELATGDSSSVRKRSVQTQLPTHSQEQFTDGFANVSIYEDQPNHDQIKISIQNTNPVAGVAPGSQGPHPIETTALLYQTFLRDQNIMDGLARQSLFPNTNVPIPTFHSQDVFNLQQTQLQQQMLLGLSQCYKLLYLQNVETQRLQQLVQGYLPNVAGANYPESCLPYHGRTNPCDASESHVQTASPQWHRDNISAPANAHAHRISTTLSHSSAIPDSHETLNNQVAPGNRANNYWDNFRSYSRQNLLSTAHHLNKSNDGMGRLACQSDLHLKTHVVNVSDPHEPVRQPALIQEHVETNEERIFAEHAKCSPRISRSSDVREHSDSSVVQNPSKSKVNREPRGQLTPNSKAVINCGNILNNSMGTPTHSGFSAMAMQPRPAAAVGAVSASDRGGRREAAAAGELSGNYSQTEGEIQSAVTKLISRCYGESDVIVDLLRELQKLNSQQEFSCALQVIRNFVTDYAKNQMEATQASGKGLQVQSKESSSSDADVEMSAIHHHQGCMPKLERPRFVIAQDSTSDDDSYPHWAQTRKSRQSNEMAIHPSGGISSERPKQRSQPQAVIQESKGSHLGTKKTFQNKSAGVNRKLYKNRTASSAQSLAHGCQQLDEGQLAATSSEDRPLTKSNADLDLASSDVPSSRFNIRQLETQMQDVVSSVTSFVSILSSRTFNPTLMGIVTSRMIDLVLSMMDNLSDYTMGFVPGHLESVLSNILPKYYGKRVSECESNLVTELSEILFNELALLQLMQNMVNGNKSLKLSCTSFDNGRSTEQRSQLPNAAAHEAQSADAGYHSTVQPKGIFTEATDADLVLTTKRGDDDDNEKTKEDFSCDIPDVCVSHENSGALSGALMDERSPPIFRSMNEPARISPSNSPASHRDSHNPTPLQLPELGGGVGGPEEARYFDLEVELEEGLGDTQDLAEADQTHRYLDVESLDDDAHDECLENWAPTHNFCNGDIERTEDDQQDENGAVGGVNNAYQNNNTVEGGSTRMEVTLDEVPIKLRVGGGSAQMEAQSESDSARKADGPNQEKQG